MKLRAADKMFGSDCPITSKSKQTIALAISHWNRYAISGIGNSVENIQKPFHTFREDDALRKL